MPEKRGLTRRQFIQQGSASVLALGLSRLSFAASPDDSIPVLEAPPYIAFDDVYRERWTWDSVARGTHTNTNCVGSCAWNLYAREGIVWREEQAATYAPSNENFPDFNPRGCNKGACASDLFVGPSRVTHPLRRVGPRGSGEWKRISWDEALDEIADHLVDELSKRGGKGVVCELGPNVGLGPNTVAPMRFFRLIGAPLTDSMAMIGDLPVGGTITLGMAHTDGTNDDWLRSKYLVLWAFNPIVSRIPDAHFVTEARYRGAKVVTITPEYSQTAIRSNLWLSPKPGSDAALALAACQVILEEGLVDSDYIREQTDLPFLVRTDTNRFLRESDLLEGGSETRFAIWDAETDALAWAPGSEGEERQTLALGGVRPRLEANRTVLLPSGDEVRVETVLQRLRRSLDAGLKPERAAKITGISAQTIRSFAREFAAADAALIVSQYGMCKNYHSDLTQRAQILLASLTGNLGRAGGGWRAGSFLALEGMAVLAMQEDLSLPSLLWTLVRSKLWPEDVKHDFDAGYISSTLFHAVHGGLDEISAAPEHGDPQLPLGADPYLREAVAKGHFPVGPSPDENPPSIILSIFSSVLRHARSYPKIRERLFDPARLVVDVNFKMSDTGRYSDIILPAASWYERVGLKYIIGSVPYVTLGDRAVPPRGEAKPEWEIFALLSEKVAKLARDRDVDLVKSWNGEQKNLAELGDRFTDYGRFGPHDQEAALEFILEYSTGTEGVTLADLRREGTVRMRTLGPEGGLAGVYSEYSMDEPVVPFRDFVEKKRPYPTLTGRQQFYIDHEWFLRLGEELPVHKPSPTAGGDYPLFMTGGHTRWSIHAQWRDERILLRLQRGEPVVYLNPDDCAAREIGEHDLVRVYNDLDSYIARAKPTGAIRPGQAHIYHAWESYQFKGGVTHQALTASPIKVTQLVGDYGQLHWEYSHYEPNQIDRDTRVEVEKYEPEEAPASPPA
jgi:DMSO reductase family type II enzyme molybdopterin subunit